MTDEEITKALAEQVMGWEIKTVDDPLSVAYGMRYYHKDEPKIFYWVSEWQPLTNIAHAWQVVERMREKGFLYRIIDVDDHEVQFYRHNQVWSVADSSLCFAIALAALKVIAAVEGE